VESKTRSKEDIVLEIEVNNHLEAQRESQKNAAKKDNLEAFANAEEVQSSEGSEFVEATHPNFDNDSNVTYSTNHPEDIAQKDMEFPKASYANLTEIEENDVLQANLPPVHVNMQFVTSILIPNVEIVSKHAEDLNL